MMRLTLVFQDRDGNQGRTSTHRTLPATVAEITAAVNSFAAAVSALSNAQLVAATVSFDVGVPANAPAAIGSSVANGLLVIGRSASDEYASVFIPSARLDLPYDTVGPYAGYRLQNAAWYSGNLGRSRRRDWFLAGMVRPDGITVIPELLVAAMTVNRG